MPNNFTPKTILKLNEDTTKGLDAGPRPECGVLGVGEVDRGVALLVVDPNVGGPVVALVAGVAGAEDPGVVPPVHDQTLPGPGVGRGSEQCGEVVASLLGRGDQGRQQRLQGAGAVIGAFLGASQRLGSGAAVTAADRAGRCPAGPLLGFVGGPALDVKVESTDVGDDPAGAQSWLPVATDIDRGPPRLVGLLGEGKVGLGGIDRFDLAPEDVAQVPGKSPQGRVVQVVAAARQVARQHLGHVSVGQIVGIDKLSWRHRRGAHRAAEGGGDTGREVPALVQDLPGEVSDVVLVAGAIAAAAGLDRVVQQPLRGQVGQLDALGGQRAGNIHPRAALVVGRGVRLLD